MPKKKKSEQPSSTPNPKASATSANATGTKSTTDSVAKDPVPNRLSIDTLDLTELDENRVRNPQAHPASNSTGTYLQPGYSLLVPAPGFEEAVALASRGVANRSNIAKPPGPPLPVALAVAVPSCNRKSLKNTL